MPRVRLFGQPQTRGCLLVGQAIDLFSEYNGKNGRRHRKGQKDGTDTKHKRHIGNRRGQRPQKIVDAVKHLHGAIGRLVGRLDEFVKKRGALVAGKLHLRRLFL